jgi:hypothetical protein
MQKLLKRLLIIGTVVVMISCSVAEYPVEEDIIELNWNSAIKDLYFPSIDTTTITPQIHPSHLRGSAARL